ncbi:MAG: hypothetical protein M3198_06265, partial [Actinomycetota bacterium]|nr:hypothetical protein [Actinomycetota bacterium]
MAEEVQVLLEPVDEVRLPPDRLLDIAGRAPGVVEVLGAVEPERLAVTGPEVLGREVHERSLFRAALYDRRSNRAVELAGRLHAPEQLQVRPSRFVPRPRRDELLEAARVLRQDERFSPLAGRPDVTIYQPMPPLADIERVDGSWMRRPTLGI